MMTEQTPLHQHTDRALNRWRQEEKQALELLQVVGVLRFDQAIELVLFRRDIYDTRPSVLLNNHRFAANYSASVLSITDSLGIAKAILNQPQLPPCRLDIGKLGLEWQQEKHLFADYSAFITHKLSGFSDKKPKGQGARDVVLYGFGRIGRLVARCIITSTGSGEQLRLKAIVIRPKLKNRLEEAKKRAALLASDSVHGDFQGMVEVTEEGNALLVNGNRIQLIYASTPKEVDYTAYDIHHALLIDNTGVWRTREGLSQHLGQGVDTVLLTAPGKDDIPNIVYGVNTPKGEEGDVVSAASCTTNAISPVLQVIEKHFGVAKGHIETVHAYTNDQNLLDNFHKKSRRGRGAPINMVLTSTGAAEAVSKVLPALEGKLTGNAIRVPTPNASLVILNLTLDKPTTVDELNSILKEAALHGDLVEQIQYSISTEYVSSNAVGASCTSVVDAPSTIVSADGKSVTIYLWYDNEFGYSCQVVRLAKHLAKVGRYTYY